jgi:hypothetical protein
VKLGIEKAAPDNGKPIYRLSITDPHTREVLWAAFGQDVADALVAAMTGIQVVARMPPQ